MSGETRYVASGADHHPMRRFVEVEDGEPLTGAAFPLVYGAKADSVDGGYMSAGRN
jgi:hypothetical protein